MYPQPSPTQTSHAHQPEMHALAESMLKDERPKLPVIIGVENGA